MNAFLVFGLLGFVELIVIFGLIHLIMSRKNVKRNWWLVPAMSAIFGFGYAGVIFIGEGEGSLVGVGESLSDALKSGAGIYLFVFTLYSITFSGVFVLVKALKESRSKN